MKLSLDAGVADYVAGISRGTPRIANSRLAWLRDFAHKKRKTWIGLELVLQAMKCQNIDWMGLDDRDRKVMQTIKDQFQNKPVGVQSLATTTGIAKSTLENEVEPWLLNCKLLIRTARGRQLTELGLSHASI
jgi:Holliday junction DNA helicase RuvB